MFEGAVVRAELVHLVLGEVADAQPLGLAPFPRQQGQVAGQDLDQGRFAGAVGTKQADAIAGHQVQFDPVQDQALAITGAAALQHQQGPGQAGRGAEGEVEGAVDVGRGDTLHTLQGLEAALGLTRLGGLGAEAFDETLDAGDLLLLAGEGRLALAEALGA